MGNFLQELNRFYKLNKIKDAAISSRRDWLDRDWSYIRYNMAGKRGNQETAAEVALDKIDPRWNLHEFDLAQECEEAGGRSYEECKELAKKALRIPSPGEVASDPQMYVDSPYPFIQEGARKLLTGED